MHQSAPSRSAPAHARRTGPAPRARAATAFKACPTAPEALERAAVEAIAAVAAHPAMGPKEVRVMCALTCLLAVPGPAIRIGRERIAARAGLSLRSIGDGLRALTGAGFIERTEPVFRKTTTTTVNELVGPIRAHRHEPDCARDSRWHVVRTALHAACVPPCTPRASTRESGRAARACSHSPRCAMAASSARRCSRCPGPRRAKGAQRSTRCFWPAISRTATDASTDRVRRGFAGRSTEFAPLEINPQGFFSRLQQAKNAI